MPMLVEIFSTDPIRSKAGDHGKDRGEFADRAFFYGQSQSRDLIWAAASLCLVQRLWGVAGCPLRLASDRLKRRRLAIATATAITPSVLQTRRGVSETPQDMRR